MKIAFLAGLICALCLLSVSKAAPTDGDSETVNAFNAQLAAENPENLATLNRQKRFTCDVLKSEAACSSHCLVLGRWKGGYCRRGTCICRQ
ncbi:defensin-like [Bactrocera tryoni]|uniref:defensin-like n=1 Tax=Bactrocera tryoni TaxID=59916 RepID=UPI001A973FFB|nr:defensin-like [Bactrocera tryoni]